MSVATRPTLAVWKFSSCDGCQLTLLDCEDELLAIAEGIEIAYFPEATSGELEGPYDVSLVEGSVTTAHDLERIQEIRAQSGLLVTIGACATAGGIQALRNFADVREWIPLVYASPGVHLHARDLDADRRPRQGRPRAARLPDLEDAARRDGAAPSSTRASRGSRRRASAIECKARGTPCVMVANGTPCLGPVTQAGCGAICPAYNRGCYGCFGPMESPNITALARQWQALGAGDDVMLRALRTFNANAPAFREASYEHE